jgi:REP element-mobilizing transposase RayT
MNKYRIHDQQGLNYLTLTTVGWVDVFTRQCYRDILIDSLKHCQEHKGLVLCGYVVMSKHIHLIAQTQGYNLSDVLRDFKKFTSKAIIKAVQDGAESGREWLLELFRYYGKRNSDNREFQIWQQDNHPVALWEPAGDLAEVGIRPFEPGACGLGGATGTLAVQQRSELYGREGAVGGFGSGAYWAGTAFELVKGLRYFAHSQKCRLQYLSRINFGTGRSGAVFQWEDPGPAG